VAQTASRLQSVKPLPQILRHLRRSTLHFGLFQQPTDMLRLARIENSALDQRQATFGHFEVLVSRAFHDVEELFVSRAFCTDAVFALAAWDAADTVSFQR
jgi:hypothetical protein